MSDPPGFDPDAPASARRYDYWRGGTESFEADRNSLTRSSSYARRPA